MNYCHQYAELLVLLHEHNQTSIAGTKHSNQIGWEINIMSLLKLMEHGASVVTIKHNNDVLFIHIDNKREGQW